MTCEYVTIVLGSSALTLDHCQPLCHLFLKSPHSLSLKSSRSLALHALELIWTCSLEISDEDLNLLKLECNTHRDYHVSLFRHSPFYQHKRLIIFDMDSTLIQQEVIDEIARFAGVMDQVSVRIV